MARSQAEEFCRRNLRWLSLKLHLFCRRAWRRPGVCALVLLAILASAAWKANQPRFVFSPEDMAGEGVASADELREFKDRYGEGTSSLLVLVPPEGSFSFDTRELCMIRKWHSERLIREPEILATFTSFGVDKVVKTERGSIKLRDVMALECSGTSDELDPKAVKEELNKSPWAVLRDRSDRLELIMAFAFRNAESERFGAFDPAVLTPLRESLEKDLLPKIPGATHYWVGAADYQWYVQKGLGYAGIINFSMLMVFLLTFRACFGTWRSGLLYISTILVTGFILYGFKALLKSPVDVLSSGLFIMLGLSALEDFTFIANEQMKGRSVKRSIELMIVPGFFTSLTTVIGFLSLDISDLAIIRRFGLWSALGAALEWTMVFIFLPSFLRYFKKRAPWVDAARAFANPYVSNLSGRAVPRKLAYASLLVFPLSFFFFSHVKLDETLYQIFPQKHEFTRGLERLKDTKGWQASVSLVYDEPAEDAAVDRAVANIQRDSWAAEQIEFVESAEKTFDWFARDELVPRSTLYGTYQVTPLYRSFVDENGIPRAVLYLKDISVGTLQKLKAKIGEICGDTCHLSGDLIAFADFAKLIPATLVESMAMSLALVSIIILFLALGLGQVRYFPHLLATSFWGPFAMLCVLAALQIPMDVMKCIFLSILIGLTGDNAIQYLFAARGSEISKGVEGRGGASVQTCLIMALVSLLYLGSYFSQPKVFGVILAVSLLAALAGDLWILKGLLPRGSPK